jgi:hypothetical protein
MLERIMLGLFCGAAIAVPGTLLGALAAAGADHPSLNAVFTTPDRVRDLCIALFVAGGVVSAFIGRPGVLWPLFLISMSLTCAAAAGLTFWIYGFVAGTAVTGIAAACAVFCVLFGYYAIRLRRRYS